MTHRLSRINVLLSCIILLLIAGWLGLTERRMHYSNVVSQLKQENKELTGALTALEAKLNLAVAKEHRALLADGTLEPIESPTHAYRNGGAGVALAGARR